MRHQCSSCFSEFFDDASSSSPPSRVFCVFCGTELTSPQSRGSAVPFGVEHTREEAVALGVIGGTTPGFPDTLRQFRAHGAARGADSLTPVHHENENEDSPPTVAGSRKLGRFWTSLAVGFAVGAGGAVLFAGRASPPSAVVAPAPPGSAAAAAPAGPLATCTTPTTSSAVPPLPTETKPRVTPLLEKRFWLERARSAQRAYRLQEAERYYRRALSQAPRDSEALAGLGELALLRGEREAADARFREALEANADYVPARVALADLRWHSGQSEAARRDYREIVEQYSADLFPPYVSQRLDGDACIPQCGPAAAPEPPVTP